MHVPFFSPLACRQLSSPRPRSAFCSFMPVPGVTSAQCLCAGRPSGTFTPAFFHRGGQHQTFSSCRGHPMLALHPSVDLQQLVSALPFSSFNFGRLRFDQTPFTISGRLAKFLSSHVKALADAHLPIASLRRVPPCQLRPSPLPL